MNLKSSQAPQIIAGILVVAAVGVAFWMLLLSPKREEASKLLTQVEAAETSLAGHRAEVATGEAAKTQFPSDYRQLVVLGKAVPSGDDTASLLIQFTRIADDAEGTFRNVKLVSTEGGEAAPAGSVTGMTPTEAEAALLPLGAKIGTAGLGVMPYDVEFDGNFFSIADFIEGLDSMVKTGGTELKVNGRLVTFNSFTLTVDATRGFPHLVAKFSLNTYVTPPDQGITGGATPSQPAETTTATPAMASTGATP